MKIEAASAPRSDDEKRALLSAYARLTGYLSLTGGNKILELTSLNAQIAKSIYECLHDLYGCEVRFSYTRSAGFLKRIVYHVNVITAAEDILKDLEVDYFDPIFPYPLLKTSGQVASYLAGAFLAHGSVADPASTNYHLEIILSDEAYAKELSKLLNKSQKGLYSSKIIKRRDDFVLYLKKSDEISDFLILIGAKENCLHFENVRVDRDFSNVTNRLKNLDTANYEKTYSVGQRQVKEINFFVERLGWDKIDNPKLKALMEIRLAHEDASLAELAELLSEELNSEVSKSNVNHLFRYLDQEYRSVNKNEP